MTRTTDESLEAAIQNLVERSPAEAAKLLRKVPKRRRATVTALLSQRQRAEVLQLAEQTAGTAGALMTSRYADLRADISVGEALHQLAAEADAATIYAAPVVDSERTLLGVVDLRDLIEAERSASVASVMDRSAASARANEPDEAAARRLVENRLVALPVVDGAQRLVGIITHDEAQACLKEAAEDDAERFSAINDLKGAEVEYLDVPFLGEVQRRAPWILGLAAAGLMAGYVVHAYESALDALVILALYMPMIADTGGNVGTQSASLVLRAVATGSVGLRDTGRVLRKETQVALALAALLFVFAFLKVAFMSNAADVPLGLGLNEIALAIAIAIFVAAFVATLIGALLPLVALVCRLDPAVVAGPALTTIVDVVGLLIYFQITTTVLGLDLAH